MLNSCIFSVTVMTNWFYGFLCSYYFNPLNAMEILSFLEKFPNVATGWMHHNGYLCFVCSVAFYFWSSLSLFRLVWLVVCIIVGAKFLMLCLCAGVCCNVKCMGFGYVLHYLAGAVASDLPVQKSLWQVFLVINVIFVNFQLLYGVLL